jgi:hypothetical protein
VIDQDPGQSIEDDLSVASSESSEPPQRKYPGHENEMEIKAPQMQVDRFERLIDKMQERVEQMYGWEEKIEKLTVSMTSMGTEISDLKTHSEVNAKATAIARMSEDELDSFLTDRCLPKFMDRMMAKQNEANVAVSKQQQEMLEQFAKTAIAEVVKEQLQLSYPTAEQNMISTFRKCLEEAVRELKKVTKTAEVGDSERDIRCEEKLPMELNQELSPPSQEFPALYRGWREEESQGVDRTLGSALRELQPEQQESEGGGDTVLATPEVHPKIIAFRTGTLMREEAGETQGVDDVKRTIFEVEGEMSNLTTPHFATDNGGEDARNADLEEEPQKILEVSGEARAAEHDQIQDEETPEETEQQDEPVLSVEGCEVDEAVIPTAPIKRYNTRNRASRPVASSVTPMNLNESATQESSEVEPSVRGKSEEAEEVQGNQAKRSNSKGKKKEKDLTGGHGNITQFFGPK